MGKGVHEAKKGVRRCLPLFKGATYKLPSSHVSKRPFYHGLVSLFHVVFCAGVPLAWERKSARQIKRLGLGGERRKPEWYPFLGEVLAAFRTSCVCPRAQLLLSSAVPLFVIFSVLHAHDFM